MLALNIDTSRLSMLALDPDAQGRSSLLGVLHRGDVGVVVCMSRVAELARMSARGRREVVALLRNVPTLIGQPESVLQEDELACGCARATGLNRRPPKAFARGTADWGYVQNTPGGTAADLVALADADAPEIQGFRTMADQHILHARVVGASAAVVTDRTVALRLALERHLREFRLRNASYGGGLTADEIIDKAGGLVGFPSFDVGAELVVARLRRKSAGEANDLLDEDIARYHPYAAASLLDHATKNRFWAANLSGRERVASTFEDATRIVEKVRAGDLHPVPSYLADPGQ